jgi:hypothetical protein
VDFRLVGARLHGKPCKGLVNRRAGGCVFNHTSDVLAHRARIDGDRAANNQVSALTRC